MANYADPRHPNFVDDGSRSTEGTASEESKATVNVTINKSDFGTYSISGALTQVRQRESCTAPPAYLITVVQEVRSAAERRWMFSLEEWMGS